MKAVLPCLSLLLATLSWAADNEARLARATSRCTVFAELIACGEALHFKPNDPSLLAAEGDALVRQGRPGEAIGVFRNAMKQSAGQLSLEEKMADAETRRQILLQICQAHDGNAALNACEAAWLPGARDEAFVFRRRGVLLQDENRLSAALDAYMVVARLRPADRNAAQSILTLSERTGREDAPTLSAEGQALLCLGHPAAALVALRRALVLAPGLADARARLKVAERARSEKMAATAIRADDSGVIPESLAPHFTNEEPLSRSN